jgi:serpin B
VLDEVAQNCYIDITESGTEAAAVTSAAISLTSLRPQENVKTMKVDRPYIFFIADSENILFTGKILNL